MPGERCIALIKADTLTDEDKYKSLDAVNLVKEKLDGTINSSTCSNGSKKEIFERSREWSFTNGVSWSAFYHTSHQCIWGYRCHNVRHPRRFFTRINSKIQKSSTQNSRDNFLK